MDFEQSGKGFLQNYYNALQNNKSILTGCYTEDSFVTYNGQRMKGPALIMEKLNSLPAIAGYSIGSVECQPTKDNGVIAVVDGELKLAGEEHALRFMEVFSLSFQNNAGQISNQIFSVSGGGAN